MLRTLCLVFILIFFFACSEEAAETSSTTIEKNSITTKSLPESRQSKRPKQNYNYELLRQKITLGKATFAEVRQAMTDKDIGRLSNTIHALYSLRWHRGVINLLDDMWALNKARYPEISWELFEKIPIKLAIASTINRIKVFKTEEYKEYLNQHKYDDHEFHRAQVIIALAFNADPKDVEYLKEMADGENHYVTQTAITGLAIMGGDKAKKALGELWKKYKDTPRGDLIEDVLMDAYKEQPSLEKPESKISNNN